MDEFSIFQVMAETGYMLLDPPHADSPGGTQLLIALREVPTKHHFDPESLDLSWADPLHTVRRTKLTQKSIFSGTRSVCAGQIVLHDRRDKRVYFFVYGGTLEVSSDNGMTVFSLHSPAPILEMSDGEASLVKQLASETESQLAKMHVTWGRDDEGFARRLAEIDPLHLYGATIHSILENYQQNSALKQSFHPFYEMLRDEYNWLTTVSPQEVFAPQLGELFARG